MTLCCTAVFAILPAGSLKRTASLAMGLTLLSFWLSALPSFLRLPEIPQLPFSLLEETGVQPEASSAPAGHSGREEAAP